MITIHPPRSRPADRRQTDSDKRPAGQVVTFPAPVRGLVTNQNFGQQGADTANVLDNFWPTSTSIEPRGGYKARVDIDAATTALFEYAAGSEFIATDASKIYTFTAATSDGTTLTADVSSLTSGDWQGVETQNDGGSFFTLVNGADNLRLYDGSTFEEITTTSSPDAITGTGFTSTADLSYVANYRERQWFVEGGTMNAWYLGINSVTGTITKFPIAGIFNKGGSLHSITTFSSDAGDGLDDRIVFLTTAGEFALYSGDPAGTISLVGVYDIGEPIARMPFIRVAGDVLVATKSGLIPISAAIQKDPSQLKTASVSQPIERDWAYWQRVQPSGWKFTKWSSRNMAIIAIPVVNEPFVYVLNLETGAWARFTGWDVDALAVLGDSLHFATGVDIFEADTGGLDNGSNFTCKMCGPFQSFGSPGFKAAKRVRGTFETSLGFTPQFSIATDYSVNFPSAPNSASITSLDGATWDVADWDTAEWGDFGNSKSIQSRWHVVEGHGFAHAVQLQITSADSTKLDCELINYDFAFVPGDT